MDLETRKSVDKYHLRVFRLRIIFHNELPIHGRMTDWGTLNSRLTT